MKCDIYVTFVFPISTILSPPKPFNNRKGLNMVTLRPKYGGEKLGLVGHLLLNGVQLVTDPYHVQGDKNPHSQDAVPVFNVFSELATITVTPRTLEKYAKSRSRIIKEVRKLYRNEDSHFRLRNRSIAILP